MSEEPGEASAAETECRGTDKAAKRESVSLCPLVGYAASHTGVSP